MTSKLDDVIDSNLDLRMLKRKKRPPKKKEEPGIDYDPFEDPFEEMEIDDLFGDYVPPQQEKQLVPKPPTYEESLKDLLEGKKEIYVDPQYLPPQDIFLPHDFNEEPDDLPPEYDEDEGIDYGLDTEDMSNVILDDLGVKTYDDVEKRLNEPEMTSKKNIAYLNKILKDAKEKRNQLKGYKMNVTKQYNSRAISEPERQEQNKRIDNARKVLNEYIKHYQTKLEKTTKKGSGIKRGGEIMFFNNAKQLLKKLELIIGERLAGNKSIEIRNTGVNILDTLLKMSTINRPQYSKLYHRYFKI